MKVAIYSRVSTNDQNVKQQHELLKKYCNSNNLKYRSYIDDGISGEVSDRPNWIKLLKECEKGIFNTIIVVKYDRITRNLKYAIEFIDWMKKYNINIVSLFDGGSFDFTPDNIFQFKLKCLLSEHELAVLRWRSRIGIDRAKREGKYKGRKKGSKNKI